MQVYLPDELYRRVKRSGKRLNVSKVLQRALEQALAEADRLRAMSEAVQAYEAEFGAFTREQLDAQWAADRVNAIRVSKDGTITYPKKRAKRRRKAA